MSIELEHFQSDARHLSVSAFAARHGAAFLVRSSSDGDLTTIEEWEGTTNPGGIRSTQHNVPRVSYRMSHDPGSRFFVYPLRKQKPSPPGTPVTIGRSVKRDVRIDDLSVSNLHAYVIAERPNSFKVIDKASRNGTRVGAELLSPGKARPLVEGVTVELGVVRTTFMTAGKLIEFLLDVLP